MSDDMYQNDSDCVAEFINLISSESNEICSKEEKRTIAPEHVLRALEVFFLKSPFLLQFMYAFCFAILSRKLLLVVIYIPMRSCRS